VCLSKVEARLVLPVKYVHLTVAWGLLNILHSEIPQRPALLKEQAEFEGKEHSKTNLNDLFPEIWTLQLKWKYVSAETGNFLSFFI